MVAEMPQLLIGESSDNNLDLDRDDLVLVRIYIRTCIEIVLINYRTATQALRAKYQIHRLQQCGLAGVVVTNKSSVSIEMDLTVGDASEVPDANTHKMHFDPP
ncbi:hypothetical protein XACG102_11210002 [Xanthomonas citri pv. citri]|nr:hypothetical protein XACG102_11210002 [Xanthomonas citri pv. citri]